MVTDDRYTWGEHNITYREVESLDCTSETNVALCVNLLKYFFKIREDQM